MIILLLVMVSVSVTCSDTEEKLVTNMEQDPETQVSACASRAALGLKTSASKNKVYDITLIFNDLKAKSQRIPEYVRKTINHFREMMGRMKWN